MALSKVKSRKQARRLATRQEWWEKLPTDKKKGFTKPGSNRK